MHSLKVKISDIRAVSFAMAKKDLRFVLNGMLVETNGADVRLVCCDGHRLHGVMISNEDGLIGDVVQYIVPDTLVNTILKAKLSRKADPMVTLTFDNGKVSALLPDGTESVASLVDGKFPDYCRVIPAAFSGEFAHYNQSYVLDAQKALGAYCGNEYATNFIHNGNSAAGGLSYGSFICVVMPMRGEKSENPSSAWNSPMQSAEKLAA